MSVNTNIIILKPVIMARDVIYSMSVPRMMSSLWRQPSSRKGIRAAGSLLCWTDLSNWRIERFGST